MTDNTKVELNDGTNHQSWFETVAGGKGRVENPDDIRPHLNTTVTVPYGTSSNNPLPHTTTVQIDNKTLAESYKNVQYDNSELIKNLNAQEYIRFIMSNQGEFNDTIEMYRISVYNEAVKAGFPKPYSADLPLSEIEAFLNHKKKVEEMRREEQTEMSGHSTPDNEEEEEEEKEIIFETPIKGTSTPSSSESLDPSELTPVTKVIKELKKHIKNIRVKETPTSEEENKHDPMITKLWSKIDSLVALAGRQLNEDLMKLTRQQLYPLAHRKSGNKPELVQIIVNRLVQDQSRVLKTEFHDDDTIPSSVLRAAVKKIISPYVKDLPHQQATKLKKTLQEYNEQVGYGLQKRSYKKPEPDSSRYLWTKLGKYEISLYYLKQRNQLNVRSASGKSRIPGYNITTITLPLKRAILETINLGSAKDIDTSELSKEEKLVLKKLFEKAKVDKQQDLDRVFPSEKPIFDKEQQELLGETSIKKLLRQFALTISEMYAGNDSPKVKEEALFIAKKLLEMGEFDLDKYRTIKKQILRLSKI